MHAVHRANGLECAVAFISVWFFFMFGELIWEGLECRDVPEQILSPLPSDVSHASLASFGVDPIYIYTHTYIKELERSLGWIALEWTRA